MEPARLAVSPEVLIEYFLIGLSLLLVAGVLTLWRSRRRRRVATSRRASGQHTMSGPAGSFLLVPDRDEDDEVPSAAQGSPGRLLGYEPEVRPRRPRVAAAVVLAIFGLTGVVTAAMLLLSPTTTARPAGSPSAFGAREAPAGADPAQAHVPAGGDAADAADTAAAASAEEMVVAVDPETGSRLLRWAGDGQTGREDRPLRRALAVVLRDSADRPMAGVEIRFDVPRGGGRVEPESALTSDLGLVTAAWWPGADPDSLRVTAYPADAPEQRVEFRATLEASPARSSPGGEGGDGDEAAVAAGEPREGAPAGASAGASAGTGASGRAASRPPPVRRATPAATLRPSSSLSVGGVHTCRLAPDEGVSCWGGVDPASPGAEETVDGQPAPDLRLLSAGVFHTCGLTAAATVYCWPTRQGADPTDAAPGREISLPDDAIPVDVVTGTEHSCALASSGRVYCWGANTHGQLGNGTTRDAADPVAVRDLPRVVQLATGWLHTCALTEEGRAYCWGANASAQLGDGDSRDRPLPVPVRHPALFTTLSAGSAHTCGLTADGTAWCWGSNEHGQLGTGGVGAARTPAQTAGGVRFRTISAGGVHTCGLDVEGRAWCWGRNTFGQLGLGTTAEARAPTAVTGGHRFAALQAGGAHTCGELREGALMCWGNNMQGQVGDGSRDHRTEPVRISRE